MKPSAVVLSARAAPKSSSSAPLPHANLLLLVCLTLTALHGGCSAASKGPESSATIRTGASAPRRSAGDERPLTSSGAPAGVSGGRQLVESAHELRALESNIANAQLKVSGADLATAAGHHHGKSHGKYYMYAEVPKKHSYKMGFKRGNHKHLIERKESAHKSHVHSYFKWSDKKGKGSHKFEFKHHDHHKKKHHY